MTRKQTNFNDWGDSSSDQQQDADHTTGAASSESTDGTDDVLCPCYNAGKKYPDVDDGMSDIYGSLPKCGHAVDYLSGEAPETLAQSTVRSYGSVLRGFIIMLHENSVTVREAELKHVKRYLKKRAGVPVRMKTLKKDKAAITNLYKYMCIQKDIQGIVDYRKIKDGIKLKNYNVPSPIKKYSLTDDEVDKLFSEIQLQIIEMMTEVGLQMGPRNSSVCILLVEDVDLEQGEITV
jgi:hypothetical protein